MKKLSRILMALAVTIFLGASAAPVYAISSTEGDIYSAANVPVQDVAVVFGAGIDGTHASSYLQSRLEMAITLYKTGKVKVLLMSGDNSKSWYDEPSVMKRIALEQGVPAKAVVLDYAGFKTYDTCYRAKVIFGIRQAILVTHGYHLPRALMTCSAAGVKSVGVDANTQQKSIPAEYLIREFGAQNKAAWQAITRPRPTVLGPKEYGVANALSRPQS